MNNDNKTITLSVETSTLVVELCEKLWELDVNVSADDIVRFILENMVDGYDVQEMIYYFQHKDNHP